MATSPPSGQRHGHRGKPHPEALVFRQEVMIHIPSANGHRRQILAQLHLILQTAGLHILLQQGIFTGQSQGRLRVAVKTVRTGGQPVVDGKSHRQGIGAKARILRQHVPRNGQSVLQLQAAAFGLVPAKLHLQQIVACHHACLHRGLHIAQDTIQLRFHLTQSLEFLLQSDHSPEILLRGQCHFIVREVPLQTLHLYPHFGQLVSVHNLPASKERQGGAHSSRNSVLEHGHVHVRSHIHLHQSFIRHKASTRRHDTRKIIGKRLLLVLSGHFQFVTGILHPHIVCQGSLNTFIQRVGFLSEGQIRTRPTYQ